MKSTFFTVAVITAITGPQANAANVPQGTLLAERQEIVRHIKDEPASLDPAKAVGLPEMQIIRDLFEGLTSQDEKGNIIPGVATQWQSQDNKTWLFTLRDNARWTNGEPVTAWDFVYSWRRLVNPVTASPTAWFADIAGIENAPAIIEGKMPPDALGVTAKDATHLQVTLTHPVAWFPSLVSNVSFYPVLQKTVEQNGESWTQPAKLVGNGAYQLTQQSNSQNIVLHRNLKYWDNDRSVLNKVIFMPLKEESVATKRYLAGEIDITESFPKASYARLKQQIPQEIYTPDQLAVYYYAFNTRQGATADKRVRRALSWSIDRRFIADSLLATGEKPAWYFTPEITHCFHPMESVMQQHTQEELNMQAKTLLASAGYGPTKPLRLTLLYNSAELHQKIARAIAKMWKENLGVEVKLVSQNWKNYLNSRNRGKFDVIRASWVGDYNEPSSFLTLLTSSNRSNIAKFNNPEYDALMSQVSRESNEEQRSDIYNRVEQLIAEEAPIAPIYQYTNARLIKPYVKGYPINNPEDVAYSRQLYIVQHP